MLIDIDTTETIEQRAFTVSNISLALALCQMYFAFLDPPNTYSTRTDAQGILVHRGIPVNRAAEIVAIVNKLSS